jgi:WD40 repeat protein
MAVAYAEDDSALVSVATEHDVSIRLWGTAGEQPRTVKLETEVHGNFFLNDTLRLSADGSTIVAAPRGEVHVWNTQSGKRVETLAAAAGEQIAAVAVSSDGSVAAGAGSLGSGFPLPDSPLPIHVWDVGTGKLTGEFSHTGGLQIHDVALSADGRLLASASQEAGTMVWDLTTGERLHAIANDNTGREHPAGPLDRSAANQVLSLAFSPDGSVLATGDIYGVRLYGVATGQLMRLIHAPFRYGRSALVFSPDGQRLARVAADKTVVVWDAGSGVRLFELQTDSNCAAFSRDGRQLAVGFSDGENALKVFELSRE